MMLAFRPASPRTCAVRVARVPSAAVVIALTWFGALNAPGQTVGPVWDAVRPPVDADALAALESELTAEMSAVDVDPLVGPFEEGKEPSPAERERIEAARNLCDALREYVDSLRQVRELRAYVVELDKEESNRKLGEDLASLATRTNEIKATIPRRPRIVTDQELLEAEQERDAVQTDINARAAKLRERRERLEAAGARRDAAAKQVQDSQAALLDAIAQFETKQAAAGDDAARAVAQHRARRAQVVASLALSEAERAALEERRDARMVDAAQHRAPVERELLAQLQDRLDQLKRFRTQTEADQIRATVEWLNTEPSASPYERAYWQLRLGFMDALRELRQRELSAGLKGRFTEEEFADLQEDVSGEVRIWNDFAQTLKRRPREQIRDRYAQLGRLIPRWQTELTRIRELSDRTFDHRAGLLARKDELVDQLRPERRRVRELQRASPSDEIVIRYSPQLAEAENKFDAELAELETTVDQLAQRLDKAIALVDAHVIALSNIRSRTYFAYLGVQDQQVWKYRLSKSIEEWNSERRRDTRARDIARIKSGANNASSGLWATFAAALLATAILAQWARNRLLAHARSIEASVGAAMQETSATLAPLSDRLHIQAIDFLASTAHPIWPALVALAFVHWGPFDGRIVTVLLCLLMGAFILRAVIRTVFTSSKPRFRVVPCSNVVARYYRRWLLGMFWVTVLILPVPLFLHVMNWSSYTLDHLAGVYKMLMLGMILAFATRKHMVMRVAGRPEDMRYPVVFALVSFLYPLICLFVAGLFVVQFLGYGALTTYIIVGVGKSFGTAALAVLAWRYLNDIVQRIRRRLQSDAEAADPVESAKSGDAPRSEVTATVLLRRMASERSDEELWLSLVMSLIRWAGVLAIGVLILGYWGVPWVGLRAMMDAQIVSASPPDRPSPMTVGDALGALAVVAVSWILARTLRKALQRKVDQNLAPVDRGGWIAIGTLLQYFLVLCGLYFALYMMQIPLGALTVVLGTLGLGLGLALQPLFSNFFSGLVILFERHIKVGDTVALEDGTIGEVTSISVRATTIKTPDNIDIVVPNGEFISGRVTNWSLDDTIIRARLQVGVVYGSNPRQVEQLLLQVARESPLVLTEPKPEVRFMEFGDNSLNFTLFAWCRNSTDRWNFVTNSRYRILELFEKHGIEIPFPQRTLTTADDKPIRIQLIQPDVRRAEPGERTPSLAKRGGDGRDD